MKLPAALKSYPGLPMTARLLLRKTKGSGPMKDRTMVGGVVLAQLCPDDHECILQGELIIAKPRLFRLKDRSIVAGRDMGQLMTGCLGEDVPNEWWEEVK